MIPTVGEVYDLARQRLGEGGIPGGEAFGTEKLEPNLGTAFRKLLSVMQLFDTKFVQRRLYYTLPANTVALVPSLAGVNDFGSPIEVRAKDVGSTHTVTAVTANADSCDVTLSGAHGLSVGDLVYLYNVGGFRNAQINDEWVVTSIPGATQVRLGGCVETGTYTSGGTMVAAPGQWNLPYQSVDNSSDLRGDGFYLWSGEVLRFSPLSQDRLLQVEYALSGRPPKQESRSLHVDDSLDFLACYTAYLAASDLGADKTAANLLRMAVGNDHDEDARGGHLGVLISNGIKVLQNTSYVHPRYRPRRNTGRRSRTTLGRY